MFSKQKQGVLGIQLPKSSIRIGRSNPKEDAKKAGMRLDLHLPLILAQAKLRFRFIAGDGSYLLERVIQKSHEWNDLTKRFFEGINGSGLLTRIYEIGNENRGIICQVWLRPPNDNTPYPRFNVPSGITWRQCADILKDSDIYQLTVRWRKSEENPQFFCFSKYKDIPHSDWESKARHTKSKNPKEDMIIFPKYTKEGKNWHLCSSSGYGKEAADRIAQEINMKYISRGV